MSNDAATALLASMSRQRPVSISYGNGDGPLWRASYQTGYDDAGPISVSSSAGTLFEALCGLAGLLAWEAVTRGPQDGAPP